MCVHTKVRNVGTMMKKIERPSYINKLIWFKNSDMIKVITGIRRVGKSYLLFNLYYDYLKSIGVDDNHIIKIDLDNIDNLYLHDSKELNSYVESKIIDKSNYYLFIDEIQFVDKFELVLNGLNKRENLDIYVTGSNSKFLSSDIITEFRGRTEEIRVYPLTFKEFSTAYDGSNKLQEYLLYGGMPHTLSYNINEDKSKYLKNLFENTYYKDIIERNNITRTNILDNLVNILASSVGSLTNPTKIAKTFESSGIKDITDKTISNYIEYLINAFIIYKVDRYDIKGRKYISTPSKYYFTDLGLRNAKLNFRQYEETHLMENAIYNELIYRGFNVDVGTVEHYDKDSNNKTIRQTYEIDFICNKGYKRYYIQSAFSIEDNNKLLQEERPFKNISDNFQKIIITKNGPTYRDENGILIINLEEFLLNENILDN